MLDIFHMNNTQCQFSQYKLQSGHRFLEEVSQRKRFRKARRSRYCPLSVIPDLFKSCKNDSLLGWFSNCWINFFTVSSPTSFTVTSVRCALVVWGCSCFLIRLILLPTLRIRLQYNSRQRGDWYTWWKSSSLVFCRPLPQYKSQVVCCGERLRVIVFDKFAILSSERALNCTQNRILMRSPSVFVWCDRWLVQVASNFFRAVIIVHRIHCSENTDCLSPLRLFPPGINPLLIIECISLKISDSE